LLKSGNAELGLVAGSRVSGTVESSANERSSAIMAQVVVTMKTIDLKTAEQQPVTGEDVKTLQALLNIFLTAGDIGEVC
jgi:hypothetical protein